MIKLRWDIAEGKVDDFKANQRALCKVMLDDHPGVICYHVEYPEDRVSEWIEIYATDDAFRAHLANQNGQRPLKALAADCDKITVRCFGDPNEESREILGGFGTTYFDTAPDSFVLHPRADKSSAI